MQSVFRFGSVLFSVAAKGAPLLYQWHKNGNNIAGKTASTLSLSNIQPADAGTYSVTVFNDDGLVVSSNASVIVREIGEPVARADGLEIFDSITKESATALTLETQFPDGYIFYTLDGTTPTFSSSIYTGPIIVTNTVTVRALALSFDFSQIVESPPTTILVLGFTVNVLTLGGGAATVSPVKSFYTSNSIVTLTAMPAAGWSFLRWQGDVSETNNPLNLTVTRPLQVKPIFVTTTRSNLVGSGQIEITPAGPAAYGSTVQLRAIPTPGHIFVAWGNAVLGTNNPRSFTVTEPTPIVAALFSSASTGVPTFFMHPASRSVSPGGNANFSMAVVGSGSFSYQWRFNGLAIPEATAPMLLLNGIGTTQAGMYDVVVTGTGGSVTSAPAYLAVTELHLPPIVSVLGAAGMAFRVDYTDDLRTGLWQVLTNSVLAAPRQDISDFDTTNRPQRFYRVTIIP